MIVGWEGYRYGLLWDDAVLHPRRQPHRPRGPQTPPSLAKRFPTPTSSCPVREGRGWQDARDRRLVAGGARCRRTTSGCPKSEVDDVGGGELVPPAPTWTSWTRRSGTAPSPTWAATPTLVPPPLPFPPTSRHRTNQPNLPISKGRYFNQIHHEVKLKIFQQNYNLSQ